MTIDRSPTDHSRRRWLILLIVYLGAISYSSTLQSVPPVLTLIVKELGLTHTEAGLLMSVFSVPGIFISIPAGMLADRYGQKIIFIACFSAIIVGAALCATANSLYSLLVGRLIEGAGSMTLLVMSPHLLSQWFAGRELGLAMGTNASAFPMGGTLALNILSYTGENLGWRASIWLALVIPILGLVLFLLFFTPAPGKRQPGTWQSVGIFRSLKHVGAPIWIAGTSWLMFNAATVSLFTFTPDLLKSAGYSVAIAGRMTSLSMAPAIILGPTMGWVIDRKGHKPLFIIAGGLGVAILAVFAPSAIGWAVVLLLMVGVVQQLAPGPTYALPPDIVSPANLGIGFGILATCANIGILIGPASAGFLRDYTGTYQASYNLMGVYGVLCAIAMIGLILYLRRSRARVKIDKARA